MQTIRTSTNTALVEHVIVHQRCCMNHLCDLCKPAVLVCHLPTQQFISSEGVGEGPSGAAGHSRSGVAPSRVMARRLSDKKHQHRSQLLATCPEYLLCCGHQHRMAVSNDARQILHQQVHVCSHWPSDVINADCTYFRDRSLCSYWHNQWFRRRHSIGPSNARPRGCCLHASSKTRTAAHRHCVLYLLATLGTWCLSRSR